MPTCDRLLKMTHHVHLEDEVLTLFRSGSASSKACSADCYWLHALQTFSRPVIPSRNLRRCREPRVDMGVCKPQRQDPVPALCCSMSALLHATTCFTRTSRASSSESTVMAGGIGRSTRCKVNGLQDFANCEHRILQDCSRSRRTSTANCALK